MTVLLMTDRLGSALAEGLDCMKAAGLITKYSIIWEGRSEAPKVIIWRACDTSDAALRRSIADGLAGLVGESQLTVERG
jgi:hypothetical protein